MNDVLNISNIKYLEEIPWLFSDAKSASIEWNSKIQQYEKEEKTHLLFLQNQINTIEDPSVKKRLSKIREVREKNLKIISDTLQSLKTKEQVKPTLSTQQVPSYFINIFRDWAWKDNQECKSYLDFVTKNMNDTNDENILILGSGASRLSYDLANNYPKKYFISFDHNPFLLLTAKKIFQGHEVKLHDYTYYPKSLDTCTQTYKIKINKLETNNHQFVLGSFPLLPIKEESLDVIIAPWFFDILDLDFKDSIIHSLKYLKPNGKFLFYGPSNIHKKILSEQLCSDEIKDFLFTLFEKGKYELKDLLYLNNPLTSQNRIEQVLFFSGENPILPKEVKLPAKKDESIKHSPSLDQYKAFNQTYYHILKHIDSDINFTELAKKIATEFGFNQDESIYYAKNFIQKINQDLS